MLPTTPNLLPQPINAVQMDLSGSTFTRVCLSNAVFHDVNLAAADIDDVNMSAWTVHNANMSNWTVRNVNFSDSRIGHADLRNLAIVQCMTHGMTIDGIAVADLMAAYQASRP